MTMTIRLMIVDNAYGWSMTLNDYYHLLLSLSSYLSLSLSLSLTLFILSLHFLFHHSLFSLFLHFLSPPLLLHFLSSSSPYNSSFINLSPFFSLLLDLFVFSLSSISLHFAFSIFPPILHSLFTLFLPDTLSSPFCTFLLSTLLLFYHSLLLIYHFHPLYFTFSILFLCTLSCSSLNFYTLSPLYVDSFSLISIYEISYGFNTIFEIGFLNITFIFPLFEKKQKWLQKTFLFFI